MATAPPPPPARNVADRLAYFVIVFAGVILVGLIIATVVVAPSDQGKRLEVAQNVFNAVLPLIASWVGTVLAYYYSRENLNAATRNATEMAQQLSGHEKLQVLNVRDMMIPRERIDAMPVAEATKLSQIIEFLQQHRRQRLPVFDERGAIRYIVHLSTVHAFLSESLLPAGATANPGKPSPDQLTFADLLADAGRKDLLSTSFGVVAETATLAEAKAALEQGRAREDVFITRTGKRDEPVLGWITDNDLVRLTRA